MCFDDDGFLAADPRGMDDGNSQVVQEVIPTDDAAYDMIYRMTSGDAARVSRNALDRHVQADEHRKIVGLLFQPETRDLGRA